MESGLASAFVIKSREAVTAINWPGVREWTPDDGLLWLHLDYAEEKVQQWLRHESGLDDLTVDSLLSHDPRPRSLQVENGLLVIVRGVNLNKGADPEDMVALRAWIDKDRVITMRHRNFNAVNDLRIEIECGRAPTRAGDLLIDLIERILSKIATVVDKLDDDVDDLEDQVIGAEDYDMRHQVAQFRRTAIALRRHVAPQREVLAGMRNEKVDWLSPRNRAALREADERLARIIDELDSAKERALVTTEELNGRLSEMLNRRLYGLSLVSAIFLPLGFVTGALGVNLDGMPGTETPWAFAAMCVAMVGLGLGQVWFFRKSGWF